MAKGLHLRKPTNYVGLMHDFRRIRSNYSRFYLIVIVYDDTLSYNIVENCAIKAMLRGGFGQVYTKNVRKISIK